MKTKIDKSLMIISSAIIITLFLIITLANESFVSVLNSINYFLSNRLGFYYILFGIFIITILLAISFSKYGSIRVGGEEAKKEYSTFSWASMIFTSTMAADIIFFSLHEWIYYFDSYKSTYLSSQPKELVASTYPLFHWGFIPWSIYLVPAATYAYISYNQKRDCNKLSQACMPLVKSNKLLKIIDITGIVGLIVAVSTTFSLATPLMTSAVSNLFSIGYSTNLVVTLIIIMGIIYTIDTLSGIDWLSKVANISYTLFLSLIALVLFSSDTRFIINQGISSLGNLLNNSIGMSSFISTDSFTSDWTIFYWAYWIAWSIATPFFIAKISKGRTIRNILLAGLISGVSGTFVSFIVLGNAGLSVELANQGIIDKFLLGEISESEVIINILSTMPNFKLILVVMVLCMIFLYVTTLNSIIYTVSNYSYTELGDGESSKPMRIYWSFLFLILPIALVYLDSTMATLKILSIILAFPTSMILMTIIINFIRILRKEER